MMLLSCKDCINTDDPFDHEDCVTDIVRCVRTADCCANCTCTDLELVAIPDTVTDFLDCYCVAGDTHHSLEGTIVVMGITVQRKDNSDPDLVQLAQLECNDPEAVPIWKFFKSIEDTNLDCPISSSTWAGIAVSIDGGPFLPEAVNPTTNSFTLDYPGPKRNEDGTYDCINIPQAILVQIVTSCGNLLVACPILFPQNTVICEIIKTCCKIDSVDIRQLNPCEEGSANVEITTDLLGPNNCECNSPEGYIEVTREGFVDHRDFVIDGFPFTSIDDFVIPCTGGSGDVALIRVHFTSSTGGCDPISCDYEDRCYSLDLSTEIVTSIACP